MGFFDKFLGKSGAVSKENAIDKLNWQPLTEIGQLDNIVQTSNNKAVAIFKHSTRCSISTMAKGRLERNWSIPAEVMDVYYLDIITYRPISNKIMEQFGVQHESPQFLVLKNGAVVYHSSHNAIRVDDVKDYIS